MVIVKKLAAELQIQFVTELSDPLFNMLLLHGKVFVVVESDFHVLVSPAMISLI